MLAFHRRDAQEVAERIDGNVLRKGLLWNGVPTCLQLRFGQRIVSAELDMDGEANPDVHKRLRQVVRHMLGLTQPVEEFEREYRKHPLIGTLIRRNRGLRVPLTATPFEAMAWAITGQQISVSAAVSVRRKFIQLAGRKHSSGLWCFPEAPQVVSIGEEALRGAGFSRAKAQTLIGLSQQIASGALALAEWADDPDAEQIREHLIKLRGIGPWTVNYALLRGFGHLDGSLHGDVAVRRNLRALLNREDKIGEAEAQSWLAAFTPWRALVAAHLWAMKKVEGY
ncbi:MAG: 3-methyladenine DNA glycosylase 2 [Burkholderiales bacterium]